MTTTMLKEFLRNPIRATTGAFGVLALAMAIACPTPSTQPDSGTPEPVSPPLPIVDSGQPEPGQPEPGEPSPGPGAEPSDGGANDGGTPEPSVGPGVEPDGGTGPEVDAGENDAGVDAGSPPVDAGPPGPIFRVAAEGEACFTGGGVPCANGLVCAPIFNSGAGTCAQPCDTEEAACSSGGTCSELTLNAVPTLVCADRAAPGSGCDLESLILCGPDAACFNDPTDPLGGTCRQTCSCPQGAQTCAATCGPQTCVVLDETDGSGICGAARNVGQSCSPSASGTVCAGDAICILNPSTPGSGTCRARCETPGDADPACLGLGAPHACFGTQNDGTCFPTTNLPQGAVCTTGTPVPEISRTCAAGSNCISVHDDDPAGIGRCLKNCAGNQAACVGDETCFNVESVAPGGGSRCLRELPRGSQGCNPPEPTCEDICVVDGAGGGICRLQCSMATCPGGSCACGAGEECVGIFADPTIGVCGTVAQRGESCNEDEEIFCAAAPNSDVATNAFSICLGTCYFVCEFDPADGPVVNLDCPAGLQCVPDPTGRLLSTVKVCVEPPQQP